MATLNAEINNDMNSKELDRLWDEDPTEAARVDRKIQKRKQSIQQAQQKLREHQAISVPGNIKRRTKKTSFKTS